jgi:hypothetical protein
MKPAVKGVVFDIARTISPRHSGTMTSIESLHNLWPFAYRNPQKLEIASKTFVVGTVRN